MKARHALHRAGVVAASAVLLLQAACEAGESPGSSGASPAHTAASAETTSHASNLQQAEDTGPASCPAEPLPYWSVNDITTHELGAYGTLEDVAVSQTGTTTVAWTVSVDSGEIRTMDVPAAPGDPQSPAGPPDPQHREVFDHDFMQGQRPDEAERRAFDAVL